MFSIIIPTYNRAHILPRTIASVQAQTFTSWECIIVDDGSTNNTKKLIVSTQLGKYTLHAKYLTN